MINRVKDAIFRTSRLAQNQSGQVVVLVALLSTALASTLVLAVDLGSAYQGRRQLQTSVDAAALAGAMDIAEGRSQELARATVTEYVARNLDEPLGSVEISFPDSESLTVEAKIDRQTFFARLFGKETMRVGARATASLGLAGKVSNLMPIIVPQSSVEGHVGAANSAVFELGDDRPLESLSITYSQSGALVTYTVAYVNTSDQATDLEMWSSLPGGAEYVGGSATDPGVFDGTEVRWQWSGVGPGDSRTANFTVNFEGQVNARNDVYARAQGNQVESASTDSSQRGFFWLTDFDDQSNGTPDYSSWIVNGYPGLIAAGQVANGTGVRAALKSALDERVAKDPAVVLPLYDYTEGGGHAGAYHVVGFAEFYITGFSFNGNPKTISGYFTQGTVTTGVGEGQNLPDYGVKVIWLSD